jgi:uncharacterized protein YqfA (UPF0365 family)
MVMSQAISSTKPTVVHQPATETMAQATYDEIKRQFLQTHLEVIRLSHAALESGPESTSTYMEITNLQFEKYMLSALLQETETEFRRLPEEIRRAEFSFDDF